MAKHAPDPPESTLGWLTAFSGFRSRRFLAFLLLGIAAGAPLASSWEWMAGQPAAGGLTAGIGDLTGILTMVVLARLLLGPWLDLAPPLGFARLGRRRGWTLLLILLAIPCQIAIGVSTPGVAPVAGLFLAFVGGALLATIDAWRAEAAEPRAQGILAAGQYIGAFAPVIAVNFGTVLLGVGAGAVSAVGGTLALIVGAAALAFVGQRTRPDRAPALRDMPPVRSFALRARNFSPLGRRVVCALYGACVCPITVWFARLGPVAPMALIFLAIDAAAENGGLSLLAPLAADGSFSMERLAVLSSVRALEPLVQILGALAGAVVVARLGARRALPWAVLSTIVWHIVVLAAIPAMPSLTVYVAVQLILAAFKAFGFIVWLAWLVTITVRPFSGWQLTILGLIVAGWDMLFDLAGAARGVLGTTGAEILFTLLAVVALALALWLARHGPGAARAAWPEIDAADSSRG